MAMSAQAVHDELEPRLRKMEAFRWWIVGLGSVVVLLSGAAVQTYQSAFNLYSSVALHAHKLDALESELREQKARVGQLAEANERLRRNVVVLWDRQPKGPPGQVDALVHHGRVERVDAKQITILPEDLGEPLTQFPLSENIPVNIAGKTGTIQDVKVGMGVGVVTSGGKIISITVESPAP